LTVDIAEQPSANAWAIDAALRYLSEILMRRRSAQAWLRPKCNSPFEKCPRKSSDASKAAKLPSPQIACGAQVGGSQMPEAEIGWIAAIVIGGLAGWFAEMFMKSGTGIFLNIILGIIGAALANWLLGFFGIALGGWIGYLIAGFVGACIIIALWRMIRSRS
jgi:uncharacterized membrane protein YeaQ/YmgE (transglycosylase-associated protein family)